MEIREDKVLEFRALTTSRKIFEQMREVSGERVEFIGWVKDTFTEYYVGKLGNTLVRVSRMDMMSVMANRLGKEKVGAEAQKMNIGPTQYLNIALDEYRDTLPQIFLK